MRPGETHDRQAHLSRYACRPQKVGKMKDAMNNSFLSSERVDPDYDECDHDKLCDSDDD